MPTTEVELRRGEPSVVNFRNQKGELLFAVNFEGDVDLPHAKVITDPHTMLLIADLDV
jgi:hypothetical protein